jgi:ParB/RepB/Spo0J family partition protein
MTTTTTASKELEYHDPYKLIIIGLDTDDRDHALFDERVFLPVDESLVRNIMVYGIQQPVNVRLEEGKLYVVDGRQRVRAAREAAKRMTGAGEQTIKVPARVTRGDDARVAGIMISNNELRQGDELLVKARKASRLLDQLGGINEVALAFGRTPTTIKNWLSLVEADETVLHAVQNGKLSAAAAIELSAYSRSEQRSKLNLLLRRTESRLEEEGGGTPTAAAPSSSSEGAQSEEPPAEAASPASPPSSILKKKTGKKGGISIADVKNLKRDEGQSQPGVKHTWLRRALKTKVAQQLKPLQREVLEWFISGEAEEGTWFKTFVKDAEDEINSKRRKKA